ncbi:MAG TPA: diguanylate cyclase [Thermoanaerobaculia bacterium]|nr:diguanylate cyclase [Thermoanaerobaculia bacterium]
MLLVDDDEACRTWMMHLMRRLGFLVETAANGEDALARLRQSSFDLLIADYQMPQKNGLDLIREVRATPELAHQYAVMLTGHDDVESKVTALTSGYDDFLPKSCSEIEVVARVAAAKRILSRQRMLSDAAYEWQLIATRDELTGVATRRTLIEEAARLLAENRTVGLAIIDLDNFKPINDTYGHLAGDSVLRDLGALFLERTRVHDLIARYGGDEFVLLVVDESVDEVGNAADRLIGEIEKLQWTVGDVTFGVKATSGVAHTELFANATLDQLLDSADRDLYAKKWAKKNPGQHPAEPAEPFDPDATWSHRSRRVFS